MHLSKTPMLQHPEIHEAWCHYNIRPLTNAPVNEQIGHWNVVEKQYEEVIRNIL